MRHSKLWAGAVLLLGSLSAQAFEECEAPGATPEVPDGASAGEEAMAEAGQEIRSFVEGTQAYLSCLESHEAENAEDMSDEQRAEIIKAYNAAVEEMQGVADSFNEQVRRYQEQLEN